VRVSTILRERCTDSFKALGLPFTDFAFVCLDRPFTLVSLRGDLIVVAAVAMEETFHARRW